MYEKLQKELNNYVEKYSNISQRSTEWYNARKYKIGGSTLSTIQNNNPHNSLNNLILRKLKLKDSPFGIALHWGVLFEDVIKSYIEKTYCDEPINIIGDNIFIPGEDKLSNLAYSPDGLGIIKESSKHKIALFEFKCPYSRIPTGDIPKYYLPQVKMGLQMIPIADYGIFAEAIIRRCTWDQLGYNSSYDKSLVSRIASDNINNLPIAYGIIGLQIKKEDFNKITNYLSEYNSNPLNEFEINDIGKASPTLFKQIMKLINDNVIKPIYFDIICENESHNDEIMLNSQIDQLEKKINEDYVCCGILPYKIFKVFYNKVLKENNYLDKWLPLIDKTIETLKECEKCNQTQINNLLVKLNKFATNNYNEYSNDEEFTDEYVE